MCKICLPYNQWCKEVDYIHHFGYNQSVHLLLLIVTRELMASYIITAIYFYIQLICSCSNHHYQLDYIVHYYSNVSVYIVLHLKQLIIKIDHHNTNHA